MQIHRVGYENAESIAAQAQAALRPRSRFIQRFLYVLSDNGQAIEKHCHARLEKQSLTPHFWTSPRSPKRNPHVERFNRTVRAPFEGDHEKLLLTDRAACKLAEVVRR